MIARYVGDPDDQLFAIYHPPDADKGRNCAVLLCYPGEQEYRLAHWLFRKFAMELASQGFHAMRFDYAGTGDSAGEPPANPLTRWTTDITVAARELRELSGVTRLAVVGFRLGAVLASRASAAGLAASDLVLWEPVIDGDAYLRELTDVQNRFLQAVRYPVDDTRASDELLGFRLTPQARSEIAAIDLTASAIGQPRRVLVVDVEPRQESERLVAAIAAQGVPVVREQVDDTGMTKTYSSQAETLLAHKVLDTIVEFLAKPV